VTGFASNLETNLLPLETAPLGWRVNYDTALLALAALGLRCT
jgi:hypothetical protein